jgi:hypothetical protein
MIIPKRSQTVLPLGPALLKPMLYATMNPERGKRQLTSKRESHSSTGLGRIRTRKPVGRRLWNSPWPPSEAFSPPQNMMIHLSPIKGTSGAEYKGVSHKTNLGRTTTYPCSVFKSRFLVTVINADFLSINR